MTQVEDDESIMMAQEQTKKRLGRGLAALIGDGDDGSEDVVLDNARTYRQLPIEYIKTNPHNPRKSFTEEDIEDLANSIREKGVLQPIVVRPVAGRTNLYEIVAGERRWRAAQRANLHDVPAIVRDFDDREALEIAIVENVQRTDLNAVEEAEGYNELIARFHYTQDQLSKVIGKSRSHIANTLRLMNLSPAILDHLRAGALTAGHARALLTSDLDPEDLAARIIGQGLSVRDAERLAKAGKPKKARSAARASTTKDADTAALEKSLSEALGLKVAVTHKGPQGGEIRIAYSTLEQLDDVCRRLSNVK